MAEVIVDGVRLAYQTRGAGPPVVLVSGYHPAAAWHPVAVPALVEGGYRVVTFDHRGIPPSAVPDPPYTVERLATDLLGLIEALKLAPCHVVGTSVGGLVAQAAALSSPQLLRSVSFLAGVGNFSALGTVVIDAIAELYAMDPIPPAVERAIALGIVIPPTRWDHDARTGIGQVDAMAAPERPLVGRTGHSAAAARWAHEQHWDELSGLALPAMVVAGQWDQLFPPALARRAAASIPDARYTEIPGAPHVLFPNMAEIATALLDFLRYCDAGPGTPPSRRPV